MIIQNDNTKWYSNFLFKEKKASQDYIRNIYIATVLVFINYNYLQTLLQKF